ncbi:hypothetical protein RQP53_16830 [Paucibacter sp. APW11]|uniref:Type III secretion protein n=2 Tax=Roseateles aquae TaxID=3077235 RepID=A0ABU3PEI2_9BURK|nr:hypothetical protein [Paucibacter sp. APW11]
MMQAALALSVPALQLGGTALPVAGPAPEALAFERALSGAAQRVEASGAPSAAMRELVRPLDHINAEARSLGIDARAAAAADQALSPGELVSLTVRCQEFMFHCQLTSNIANRTSEGLQQLFRQQS